MKTKKFERYFGTFDQANWFVRKNEAIIDIYDGPRAASEEENGKKFFVSFLMKPPYTEHDLKEVGK